VGSPIFVPRRLAEEIEKRGLNLEDAIIEALSKQLNFDLKTIAESRLELAERYLAEGRSLVDKDPVQASEKLYKAAEECVKALAMHFNLEDILRSVEIWGKWTVADLEKAVKAISERIGGWFGEAWDRAWALHVWGFHEAKFDSSAVRIRMPYVEKIVEEAKKLFRQG
jgi:Archaeal PaREP1/PaREP8 family.